MSVYSTAHLMGGLGNQMFQIAHAVSQGWKNNVESLFIPQSYTPMQANQPTKYLENIFRNIKFVDKIENFRTVNSPWKYTELLVFWDKSVQFYGYFQSSKNFLGFDEKIKDLFSPTQDYIKKINLKYPDLSVGNNICIHVRRGDYLKISNILPTVDKSYIDYCVSQIPSYNKIFIISDDKKWVKENLTYDNSVVVEGLEDFEEMWLMGLCSYNILSNSSFSWWGAFLNKIKDNHNYKN